jgi:lipopolysaccharide/colanic/teichoic acid biosynthesis glycosyltransferase
MAFGLQRAIAVIVIVLLSPIIAVAGVAVFVDGRGPVLYRAVRIGRGGTRFVCYKLRTMRWEPSVTGSAVTTAGDPRVTRVGRVLRRFRLDELPQLWNVVRGEMALVGPRPEDPKYVDLGDPLHRRVFTATPGITGPSQLTYHSEAQFLDVRHPEESYRVEILPEKLKLDAAYLAHRSFALDAWILMQTLKTAIGHPPRPESIRKRL